MRFLFLSSQFSTDGSRADMFQQLAEELATRGHSADIISMGMDGALPKGPQSPSHPGLRAFVLGAPQSWAPKKGALKYLPNTWRLNFNRALDRWLKGPYDGFLFFTPGVMSAGIGERLKRSGYVRKTGFVLWDFFPIAHSEAGIVALGPAERVAFRIERRFALAADILLAMSAGGAEFAHAYYELPPVEVSILPPWGRPVPHVQRSAKFERFTCVWGGQFIARRAIPDLLEAARILESQRSNVDFRLAGDGPLLDESRRTAAAMGLRSVHFEGRLPRREYLELLMRSHVALSVIEPGSPSFPSKTVDYCQAGLPLVASVEEGNDYGQIVADAGFGMPVRAGDSSSIAAAIRLLAETPHHRQEVMACASRRFFDEHLSVEAAARTVEEAFAN